MKKTKKINKNKIVWFVRKCLSYYGAINIGCFIAVWLEYGMHLEVGVGLILATMLVLATAIGNHYKEEETV